MIHTVPFPHHLQKQLRAGSLSCLPSTSPCHPYNSLVGHECRSLDVFKNKSDLVILKSSSASRFNFCSPLLATHPSYWFDQWLLDWASNKEGMGLSLGCGFVLLLLTHSIPQHFIEMKSRILKYIPICTFSD